MLKLLRVLLLENSDEVWLPLRYVGRPLPLLIGVYHVADGCLRYLAGVLARCPLLALEEAEEAFLFCVEVDVLAKLLIDLVPAFMLA